MLTIKNIEKGSIAEELELSVGDKILSIDGFETVDVLDVIFAESKNEFVMEIQSKEEIFEIEVEKDDDERLGIEVLEELEIRTCQNKCVFCFVDQMPKGMRPSLYVKDDDYRMSFISGNYITLTNDKDEDIDRIIRLGLSPIYVSVHATNPKLRETLLSNRFAGKILEQIKKLTENGIVVHAQVVLCPNLNDKSELVRTMKELFAFYPMVKSLAIVPVGLTKHRNGLYQVTPADKEFALQALQDVEEFSKENPLENNEQFAFCSDEFYCLADLPLPSSESYGDYPQIENGVGLIRKFEDEFNEKITKNKKFSDKKTLLLTGASFFPHEKKLLEKINCPYDLKMVKNKFFGDTVTVAGLLTGRDIKEMAMGKGYERLILPHNVLKEFGTEFLDDITKEQLEKELNLEVVISPTNGGEFFDIL